MAKKHKVVLTNDEVTMVRTVLSGTGYQDQPVLSALKKLQKIKIKESKPKRKNMVAFLGHYVTKEDRDLPKDEFLRTISNRITEDLVAKDESSVPARKKVA